MLAKVSADTLMHCQVCSVMGLVGCVRYVWSHSKSGKGIRVIMLVMWIGVVLLFAPDNVPSLLLCERQSSDRD